MTNSRFEIRNDQGRRVRSTRPRRQSRRRSTRVSLSRRGRHRVGNFCALDSLRSYFKRPCDHESDRKTDHDQSDDQSHHPVRNFQEREDLGRDLDEQPSHDAISDRDLVHVATLQFSEEGLRIHRVGVCHSVSRRARDSRHGLGSPHYRHRR